MNRNDTGPVQALRPLVRERRERARVHWRVARSRWSDAQLVLVCQMGKVGSTSVQHFLEASPDVIQLWVQRLTAESIAAARSGGEDRLVQRGNTIRRRIVEPGRPAHVVSLVRDPIARNLSAYFHRFDHYWPEARTGTSIPHDAVRQSFLDQYPHHIPLVWFDRELRGVLGVDVYAQPFDTEQGRTVIDHDIYPTLVLRTDLPDADKAAELSAFLGTTIEPAARAQVAADKWYGERYREFLADLALPGDYVDHMLGSQFARHFFAEHERQTLRRKWLGKRVA